MMKTGVDVTNFPDLCPERRFLMKQTFSELELYLDVGGVEVSE